MTDEMQQQDIDMIECTKCGTLLSPNECSCYYCEQAMRFDKKTKAPKFQVPKNISGQNKQEMYKEQARLKNGLKYNHEG